MKNTLAGNGKLDIKEEKIMELEDIVIESIQNEIHKEKRIQKHERA